MRVGQITGRAVNTKNNLCGGIVVKEAKDVLCQWIVVAAPCLLQLSLKAASGLLSKRLEVEICKTHLRVSDCCNL